MIPGCPKCGKRGFREVITKNPPAEDLVYKCCGQRRHFYYNGHKWEGQEEKKARLKVNIICRYCKKPFIQPAVMTETKKKRSTCDKCRARLMREANQRRESL